MKNNLTYNDLTRALVEWLWEETHVVKVMGSNPISVFFTYFFWKLFVWKDENKEKEARNGPLFEWLDRGKIKLAIRIVLKWM